MRKARCLVRQILNMKNCTTSRWRYRSKTIVAFAVASLALCGVPC